MADEDDISKYFYDEDTVQPSAKVDIYKPRWPHSELHETGHGQAAKAGKEYGYFLMQHRAYDIYLYKNHFMLRWGKDWYCKLHRYEKIKEAVDGKFTLPEEVQTAILAARTMVMGDFT